jgi:poly(A) polymerase Pap1
MELAVTHVRKYVPFHYNIFTRTVLLTPYSFDLPDDVFQPGETRPSRPKKKVVKRSEMAGQKRSIGELDVSLPKRSKSA